MRVYCCLLLLLALICQSCAVRKTQKVSSHVLVDDEYLKDTFETSNTIKRVFSQQDAEQHEASLIDVPIPFYTERIPVVSGDQYNNQVVLGYQTPASADELVHLYCEQMERFGWNYSVKSFAGSDPLLVFEKPTRTCSISIRPRKNFFGKSGSDLILYIDDESHIW